jgi:hypothetical protein
MDLKEIEPKLIDLDWEKGVTRIKHKAKFKVTHGNLMNLLDLAKSNRADN